MKKALGITGLVVAMLLLTASTVYAFANAPEKGSMGVWGYIASAKTASLDLAEEQIGTDQLVVDKAVAPGPAWIVVHVDDNGMPGERVGLKHIDEGVNSDVTVKLDGVDGDKVIVAIHADKGAAGKFDFDMEDKEGSADRPFFVDKKELAKVVTVASFGVKAKQGEAGIEVSDQPGVAGTLVIDRALAPTGAWVVVHLNDDGMPGKRVGVTQIPAGDNAQVLVTLDPAIELTDSLLVAIHADRGIAGTFEFDMDDKLNSPDQPFFVDGKEVATEITVR